MQFHLKILPLKDILNNRFSSDFYTIYTLPEDTYKHKGLRQKLTNLLREKGITDEKVLQAINSIPRHYFLDSAFDERAYEDRAIPIAAAQTISQPFTVAMQSQALEIKRFDKVLEVGTGSGYQACVLAALGATVYSIERQRELYDQLNKFDLLKSYPSLKRYYGDGYEGLPTYAPFHKVIITAGAPAIPPKLIEQLRPGGIMIIPIGGPGSQEMHKIVKAADGSLTETALGSFSFVPMLEGRQW